MPGVPEQPKPREEHEEDKKQEHKEVESATQTDDGELSPERVEQLKKDPKVVVHCELQEELDKEFEERGLHFDKPTAASGGDGGGDEGDKQKSGDDKAAA